MLLLCTECDTYIFRNWSKSFELTSATENMKIQHVTRLQCYESFAVASEFINLCQGVEIILESVCVKFPLLLLMRK